MHLKSLKSARWQPDTSGASGNQPEAREAKISDATFHRFY